MLVGGRHYLPGMLCPASGPFTTGWSANSTPAAKGLGPGEWTPHELGRRGGAWQITPQPGP